MLGKRNTLQNYWGKFNSVYRDFGRINKGAYFRSPHIQHISECEIVFCSNGVAAANRNTFFLLNVKLVTEDKITVVSLECFFLSCMQTEREL